MSDRTEAAQTRNRRDFTPEEIDAAIKVQAKEAARWATRKNLPARNGMSTDDWLAVQRTATYVVLRRNDAGEMIEMTIDLPDALSETDYFVLRSRAAMRAAIANLAAQP